MAKCVECGSEYKVGWNWANDKLCKNCFDKGTSVKSTSKVTGSASSANYSSTYNTTRAVAMVVAAVGWIVVSLGCIALFLSLASLASRSFGFGLMSFLPSIGTIVAGLILVMNGQLTQAAVDIADNTGETLVFLKQQATSKE